jgi:hypothetical protein
MKNKDKREAGFRTAVMPRPDFAVMPRPRPGVIAADCEDSGGACPAPTDEFNILEDDE